MAIGVKIAVFLRCNAVKLGRYQSGRNPVTSLDTKVAGTLLPLYQITSHHFPEGSDI
jgi:hypothetical protein